MENDALQSLHNASKKVYKPVTQLPPAYWPEDWKVTHYKEYTRFPSVTLPVSDTKAMIAQLTATRSSGRSFSRRGLTLEEIGNLLKYSCGEFTHSDGSVHRAHASAGARYPVEIYAIVRFSSSSDLLPGVYHYNVKEHTLEYLWSDTRTGVDPNTLVADQWALEASVMFVATAVFWRSQNKYADRSYRYICMEAGAIIQNAYLYASDSDLQVVGYGGVNDDMVEQLLRLDDSLTATPSGVFTPYSYSCEINGAIPSQPYIFDAADSSGNGSVETRVLTSQSIAALRCSTFVQDSATVEVVPSFEEI